MMKSANWQTSSVQWMSSVFPFLLSITLSADLSESLRDSAILSDDSIAVLTADLTLTRMRIAEEDNSIPSGFCKTWLGTVVTENITWEEPRCRRCHCDVFEGSVCQSPVCDLPSLPYLEAACEEWSEDGCCCLRMSCVHDGKHYSANDWFLLTPDDPCVTCKCQPGKGLPQCLETTCPTPRCVDSLTPPGHCCPVCLTGFNCGLPELPRPNNDTLIDTAPLPDMTSRIVTLLDDPDLRWNCTCYNAGQLAQCFQLPANNNTA